MNIKFELFDYYDFGFFSEVHFKVKTKLAFNSQTTYLLVFYV